MEEYRHSDYQCAVAGIALSQDTPFTIVVSPTASGKTWIQGLIAKHFCVMGKKVAVVEPTEELRLQTIDKLGVIDYSIDVLSIESYYMTGGACEVVILNEYDYLLASKPFSVAGDVINGLWQLRGKKVIAFSATSSTPVERMMGNCIAIPTVVRFKSEYEHVHGGSPITDPVIIPCTDIEHTLTQIVEEISKRYDSQPVIVINDQDQREALTHLMTVNKFRHKVGAQRRYLDEVRLWEYGVLMLTMEEGRGVDTRFRKDARVLIACSVDS